MRKGESEKSPSPDFTFEERQQIFDRDNRRCLFCGSREVTIQHRRSKGMGGLGVKASKLTTADGVVLCGKHNLAAEAESQETMLKLGLKVRRNCPIPCTQIPYFDMITYTWWLPDTKGGREAITRNLAYELIDHALAS